MSACRRAAARGVEEGANEISTFNPSCGVYIGPFICR